MGRPTQDGPFAQIALRKMRTEARERFLAGRKAETQYAVQLKRVANHIGELVRGMAPDGIVADTSLLMATLHQYGDLLRPWAQEVAARMIGDVSRRDKVAWQTHGRMIGKALRQEIESAPTGAAMQQALQEQVGLITSLPREAAERVHKLTLEGITQGKRAKEIAVEILRTGEVTRSRAMTIARTEVSRTATELTKARALHIGAEEFVWRTSKDADVRKSHREMEGKTCKWETPPTLSDGYTTLPGAIFNCRCFAEPIIPDRL